MLDVKRLNELAAREVGAEAAAPASRPWHPFDRVPMRPIYPSLVTLGRHVDIWIEDCSDDPHCWPMKVRVYARTQKGKWKRLAVGNDRWLTYWEDEEGKLQILVVDDIDYQWDVLTPDFGEILEKIRVLVLDKGVNEFILLRKRWEEAQASFA